MFVDNSTLSVGLILFVPSFSVFIALLDSTLEEILVNPFSSIFFSKNFFVNLLKKSTIHDNDGLNNNMTEVIPKKKIKNPVPICPKTPISQLLMTCPYNPPIKSKSLF